jgi:hypothetical protein
MDVKISKSVPDELQREFIKIVDEHMEKALDAGLLSSRFSLRAFGVQMMCHGYYFERDHKNHIPLSPNT